MFIAVGRSWNANYSKYVNTITTSIDGETWTPAVVIKDEKWRHYNNGSKWNNCNASKIANSDGRIKRPQ